MDPTQDNQTFHQEGAGEGTQAPDSAVLSHNGEPKDVEYASIDFSALKNRPRKAAKQQAAAATEYAEIKRRAKVNIEENGREEDDSPKGEEVKGIEMEKETGNDVPEEEKREEELVYSNVKEALNEIWGNCTKTAFKAMTQKGNPPLSSSFPIFIFYFASDAFI